MHNERRKNTMDYYAKILIAISFAFLIYGFILDINNDRRLIDPVGDNDVVDSGDKTFVEIGVGSDDKSTIDDPIPIDDSSSVDDSSSNNDSNEKLPDNSHASNNNDIKNSESSGNNSQQSVVPTIEEVNNNLRNNIQNTYGITVYYGDETIGYSVGGMDTLPISNYTIINSTLNTLYSALGLFPNGFFKEIKDGGIPLSIYLIDSYSTSGVTGVTDSNYSYAKMSIAVRYEFEETFFHETYHYIERYMFKNGLNYNTWNSFNPSDFVYGSKNSSYSYNVTFSPDAYFVNNYAQTDEFEDRASTFEYMMDTSKASCLNNGKNIWQKARIISSSIDAVMSTVNSNTVEYWERFL